MSEENNDVVVPLKKKFALSPKMKTVIGYTALALAGVGVVVVAAKNWDSVVNDLTEDDKSENPDA